jgi:AraC-like DNA-binding protein
VAAPALRELKKADLPEHASVVPKKRLGKRKALRKRRNYNDAHLKLAVWPRDAQDENTMPFLVCVLNGRADFHFADYVLGVPAGTCIVVPAGIPKPDGSKPHLEGDPDGRSCDLLWMYTGMTPTDGVSCWICRSEGSRHFTLKNSEWRVERRFVAQLFNGFCAEVLKPDRREAAQRLLAALLLLLRHEIEDGHALTEWGRPRYQGEQQSNSPISEALAYIEEHLDEHLTIEKVARRVLLSPATFTRHFKAETGQTFLEYQTKQRLKVAEKFLATPEPIEIVCSRVGLKYEQLRVIFQRKHGCSPQEFRKRKN